MLFRMKLLYSWQRGTKGLFQINKGLLLVLKLVWGDTTSNKVRAYYTLLMLLIKLQKKNGTKYTSLYMKACSIYVMKFVAKDPNRLSFNSFDIWIKLTDSGIPRIIPKYFRDGIRCSDKDRIKTILTIFNLYRVLDFKGKLNLSTILDPSVFSIPSDFGSWFSDYLALGVLPKLDIREGFSPRLIESSGPCSPKGMNNTAGWMVGLSKLKSLYSWEFLMNFLDPYDRRSKMWNNSPFKKFYEALKIPVNVDKIFIGKLSAKEEPGKVRIFAMVDAVTQWLLYPLHRAIFQMLRFFPYDGTFNQIGELENFISKYPNSSFYSFDLSAATDRLPLALQKLILTNLVSKKFAEAWGSLLVDRDYKLSYNKENFVVKYSVGQPMGALSSWGMLALTHHLIVQYAAWLIKREYIIFKDYIVLGDDIVIADSAVANCYHYLMTVLFQVKINLAKGLMSHHGALEFAKRFYVRSVDFSPLSLKEFSSVGSTYSSFTGLLRKFKLTPSAISSLMGRKGRSSGNVNVITVLAQCLNLSLLNYDKNKPWLWLQVMYPDVDEKLTKSFLINCIIESKKILELSRLEKGTDDYFFKHESLVKTPVIRDSNKLQMTTFGDSPLYTTVKKGVTPETLSMINDMLLMVDSNIEPRVYLNRLPMGKIVDIYLVDIAALTRRAGQSPLMKRDIKNSILRNWDDVFSSLQLLKHFKEFNSKLLKPFEVASDKKEIINFISTLKNDEESVSKKNKIKNSSLRSKRGMKDIGKDKPKKIEDITL